MSSTERTTNPRSDKKSKYSHLVRTYLGVIALCVPCPSMGSTSVDICQEPAKQSHLSIAYYKNETTSFDGNLGELDREDFSTDLLFKLNDNWSIGGGHRSTILDVAPLQPQTNGYLHTFFMPVHRLSQSDKKSFRFSFAPALSASSNVTSDIDEYTSDALQLLAAVVWDKKTSDRVSWRYGICGDYRLGGFKVYPVISINWQPHADWLIEFGFPTSQLSHQMKESLSWYLRIAPNGNEWTVKDKSLEKHSQLVYEAYVFEWAINWRANEHLTLTASVGGEFDSEYKMTLLDESRVRLSSDSAARVGVALAWFF